MLFGHKRRQALVVLLLGTSASGLWLAWPWIVPLVRPVSTSAFGSDVVVVLDGGSGRFAAADRIGLALPKPLHRLLIRCPRGTLAPTGCATSPRPHCPWQPGHSRCPAPHPLAGLLRVGRAEQVAAVSGVVCPC